MYLPMVQSPRAVPEFAGQELESIGPLAVSVLDRIGTNNQPVFLVAGGEQTAKNGEAVRLESMARGIKVFFPGSISIWSCK